MWWWVQYADLPVFFTGDEGNRLRYFGIGHTGLNADNKK